MNFSLNRVWLLTRANYWTPTPKLALNLLMIFAVICLLTLSSAFYSDDCTRITAFTVGSFFLALYVMSRTAFAEYKNSLTAPTWITLPASMEEKWLAIFLATAVAVPLLFLISLVFSTALIDGFIVLFDSENQINIFNPFSEDGLMVLKAYLITHPLLFFGAIYFKKHVIVKTFGTVALVLFALLLWTMLLFYIPTPNACARCLTESYIKYDFSIYFHWMGNCTEILYPLFFWAMSYLRFKELET